MPRVRMLASVAGTDFSWIPGQIVDMDDDQAAAWADGVRGELVDDDGPPPPATELQAVPGEPLPPVPDEAYPPGAQPLTEPESFDPREHNISEVLEYLQGADEAEARVVLHIEAASQKRKGIVSKGDALLAAAAERAGSTQQQAAEVAAEASRGGGRGDTPETRDE